MESARISRIFWHASQFSRLKIEDWCLNDIILLLFQVENLRKKCRKTRQKSTWTCSSAGSFIRDLVCSIQDEGAPPPCSIPVRVKLKTPLRNAAAATTLDVPTEWDPNTKKEPIGLFFAACGRPCSFDSSYGLHEKIPDPKIRDFIHDPYGNRTHVTAVKGPCLNRLTNGP